MTKFCAVLLCAGATALACGDRLFAQDVTVGVKGGISRSDFAGQDAKAFDPLTHLVGGVFVTAQLAGRMSLQPEALYLRKGATQAIQGGGVAGTTRLEIDYLELPVLFRVQLGVASRKVAPHVFVGPALSFKTNCRASVDWGTINNAGKCSNTDLDGNISDVDFSAVVGGAADIDVGSLAFVLDARYTYGLGQFDQSGDPTDLTNRALAVMVGIRFKIKPSTAAALARIGTEGQQLTVAPAR